MNAVVDQPRVVGLKALQPLENVPTRVPPHSVAAEQNMLGGVLQDNRVWPQVSELLTVSDLYCHEHRLIFAAIGAMVRDNEPADVGTVFLHLQAAGHDAAVGGVAYLHALHQCVPSSANTRNYALAVLDRSIRRRKIAENDANTAAAFNAAVPLAQVLDTTAAVALAAAVAPQALAEWVPAVRDSAPAYDLATLVAQVRWAVEGLIQAAKVGVLVAAGGTGKTTLLLYMMVCIALGRLFLGCAVKQGSSLLLTNDDPQEDMNVALALVCRAMDLTASEYAIVAAKVRVVSLQSLEGCKTFTTTAGGATMATGLDAAIMQAVSGMDDLVLIALDTLRQFSGGNSSLGATSWQRNCAVCGS